jgi:glutamate racemase
MTQIVMIGVFDSGVGGLSVLAEIRRLLPSADLIYLADRANSPYGDRSLDQVRLLAGACTQALLGMGAEMIVVACNTASAAALHHLRAQHPGVAFVGMEPAVKPAAAITRSRVIGVLATSATFQGELFASVVGRFADGVTVVNRACPGWADLVETGQVTGPTVEASIAEHLDPVLKEGADTLVLGCTHYPFLRSLIATRAGAHVAIVDPALAVARQVASLWISRHGQAGQGEVRLLTTGNVADTQAVVKTLTGMTHAVSAVTLAPE